MHAGVCGETRTQIGPRGIAYPYPMLVQSQRTMSRHTDLLKVHLIAAMGTDVWSKGENNPNPIILDPASADSFRERHTYPCAQDRHSVTVRQCARTS